MNKGLTLSELEKRWDAVLTATQTAVNRHPGLYRNLKLLATDIVDKPLDIRDYLTTVEKLETLMNSLDPGGKESIFHHFCRRIKPSSIWQVSLLRVECKDLLDHLSAFDKWRLKTHGLAIVK